MPQTKIGLEIHTYLKIDNQQKLFCTCLINPQAKPNTNICPTCTAMPGSKPLLPNQEALKKTIKTALMLNCKINLDLIWQRKHYDWPDLPKGYQTTMSGSYSVPVGQKGNFLGIRIRDVHLEEDPARWDPSTGLLDYNRSGYPLIEIVTEPDFRSPNEVRDWLKKLLTTLTYLNALDRELGLKSDVNISIAPDFEKVELKNINTFKGIIKALDYEIARQEKELQQGKKIIRHTRAWSETEGRTLFMRSKEQALDYMYIPDPDLPLVEIREPLLAKISSELPEKPQEKLKKIIKKGIPKETALILSQDLLLAELFERLAQKIDPLLAAKWLRKELLRILNLTKKDLSEIALDEKHIIELLKMLEKHRITEETGRTILEKLLEKPFSPRQYVLKTGAKIIADLKQLERFCQQALKANPAAIQDYRAGEKKALDFLVGQVMRLTKGTAKPQKVKEIFKKLLKK